MIGDDDGISERVRSSALGRLLDEPERPVLRHFQGPRARRSLCGDRGYTTDSHYAITCERCKALHIRRAARKKAA